MFKKALNTIIKGSTFYLVVVSLTFMFYSLRILRAKINNFYLFLT